MARAAGGYPLGMAQILTDALRRQTHQPSGNGVGGWVPPRILAKRS
jgi:hypothetical protein